MFFILRFFSIAFLAESDYNVPNEERLRQRGVALRAEERCGGVLLEGVEHFYPEHSLSCGQAFRWEREHDMFSGIVQDKVVRIHYSDQTLFLENCTLEDYEEIWRHYFDFGRDYGAIKAVLSADPILAQAIDFGWGMRVLNQDPWETLISFILSANNNVRRIQWIIKGLSECFGRPIRFKDQLYYTFPSAQALSDAGEETLRRCGCGYRAPYVWDAARRVCSGALSLTTLRHVPYEKAFAEIQQCMGVGPKVADCILLYALGHTCAFPVDVWVKRVMEHFYLEGAAAPKCIKELAGRHFGAYSGIAQQYLFYYAREKKIGK